MLNEPCVGFGFMVKSISYMFKLYNIQCVVCARVKLLHLYKFPENIHFPGMESPKTAIFGDFALRKSCRADIIVLKIKDKRDDKT